MRFRSNYYINSFFWSTVTKVLSAVLGFITVPLLLGYFGKANYGLLSIATACNGYMHLMDLGMNTGAVKFFSQWAAEGNKDRIYRVARTNITFYIIVSIINVVGLLALAFWGESLFSVTHEQFIQLRTCLYILALFSTISWVATAFNQLLVADKQFAFTMQVQSIIIVLKIGLIAITIWGGLSLTTYFFWLTLVVAIAIIPYMYRCKKDLLVDSFKPANYWGDFKVVLTFSIAIFALSLFQVTATQSRPIILSIFAEKGAETVAEFRIIEVVPQFIIMVCGSLSGIFLPKSSEMIITKSKQEIQEYVVKWTSFTTILVCIFACPFIFGAKEILCAYVGEEYSYLAKWLQIWCFSLIIQMHATPAYSFILASGRTKLLTIATAVICIISMVINVVLCSVFSVGSAIIGYVVYILCLMSVYYFYIYKYYLGLKRFPIVLAFLKPFLVAILCCVIPFLLDNVNFDDIWDCTRVQYLIQFSSKFIIWVVPFFLFIVLTKQVKLCDFRK